MGDVRHDGSGSARTEPGLSGLQDGPGLRLPGDGPLAPGMVHAQRSRHGQFDRRDMPSELYWWRRADELKRVHPFWPEQIDDRTEVGISNIITILERALTAEAWRVATGHWAGDGGRLHNLRIILKQERALLARLEADNGT